MKVRVIGDVHGQLDRYAKLTRECNYSVAMGEMGFGEHITRLCTMYMDSMIDGDKHIIVPGNHDHYGMIDAFNTFLTTPGYGPFLDGPLSDVSAFYVRGAASIDKQYRTPGRDWFPEEELSERSLQDAVAYYSAIQPDIMIAHTVPQSLVSQLIPVGAPLLKFRTEHYLQKMLDVWRPKLWIFGHFHKTGMFKLENNLKTQFIGLGELATCDIDLGTMKAEVHPSLQSGWANGYEVR